MQYILILGSRKQLTYNKMSKIQDAFKSMEKFQGTPISYQKQNVESEVLETNLNKNLPEDLSDVDWDKFTIDGVNVVDLLVRAINVLIKKYNEDVKGQTDGIIFTFKDIYLIAGIQNVDETAELIKPEEKKFASLYDKNGFGWRYYCTLKALEKFETDANWDVEINDKGVDGEGVERFIKNFNPLSPLTNLFTTGGPSIFDNILKNVDMVELKRLTLEKLLERYTVTMTDAEDVEIEEEDEDINNHREGNLSRVEESLKNTDLKEKPIEVSSRTIEPQIITDLPGFLRSLGLPL